MTFEIPENPDLQTIDHLIRRYTNTAEAHRTLAAHFTELAAEEQYQASYWVDQRNAYIGRMADRNIVVLDQIGDGVA